jgi:cell division protein FtsN
VKKNIALIILSSVLLLESLSSMAEDDAKYFSDVAEQSIYLIQVGGFNNELEAKELISVLHSLKMQVQRQIVNEKWHRVLVGPYSDYKTILKAQKKLSENGLDSLKIRRTIEKD